MVEKRKATDVSRLTPADQKLVGKVIALQFARNAEFGTLDTLKGHLPGDFAPHNIHWTGKAVFGFDIEGYKAQPISRSIARFCVAAEQRFPQGYDRLFGVHKDCLTSFLDVFELADEHGALMPFLIADELLDSLFRRHGDPVVGPAARRALEAHLSDT